MEEAAVRTAVEAWVVRDEGGTKDTLVVHELALCQAEARVDIAAVNGRLVGLEIKTRKDRLTRLPRQQEVYSKVFDRVWLVADDRHIEKALDMIPGWWGVLRIRNWDGACEFSQVRSSRLNRNVDLGALVRLLWRDEVLAELESLGLADGLSRAPRRVVWERLATAVPRHLSKAQLQGRVRTRLRYREGWRVGRQRTSSGGSS